MSNLFSLNWGDVGKGMLMAFLTTVLGALYTVIQSGTFPTLEQLGTMGMAGLAAGIAYLMKNFVTNSQNKLLSPEQK